MTSTFDRAQFIRAAGAVTVLAATGQSLAAEAAWSGGRKQAIRALASHPLVFSFYKAEQIYDEMASALRNYLPDRLLRN